MKIVVCMKQVPRLDEVRFDRSNRIVREDVSAMTNPLDLQALGHALRLRDDEGGEIVALTMGPPQAREILEDAIGRGADRAIHLADKRFAGADTLATARAISRALEREKPDLVLFGRSTLDGATGQIGPQVAELADLPHLTQVFELELHGRTLHVERETERGSESWTLELPAVLSVERGPGPPNAEAQDDHEVQEIDAEALGGSPREYGTRGSPTFVKEVRELALERRSERAEEVKEGVKRVCALLREHDESPAVEHRRAGDAEHSRQIWVVAELQAESLHPESLEGIACARSVAEDLSADVVAVLLCANPHELPEELAAHGADRVLVVHDQHLAEYTAAHHCAALCAAIEERAPFAVIAPWSAQGRDYVPRVAARLGLGLIGDFVALEVDDDDEENEPDLLWIKPAWAGTVQAPIITHRSPSMGTLRPGAFRVPDRQARAEVPVEEFEPRIDSTERAACGARRTEIETDMLLDAAQTVVLVGPELEEGDMARAHELADALSGSVGATHEAVAHGLAPPQVEVSITKRSISPDLVLTLGIQDDSPLDAVRAAGAIVTVHRDADAAVHQRADLAIVSAPMDLVAALLADLDGEEPATSGSNPASPSPPSPSAQ